MNTDPNCIFCKIVAGGIPALRVYEDDRILAFLDIGPLSDGHLLIIPKEHSERLEDTDPDVVGHLASRLPRLAGAVMAVTQAAGYNVLQNNGRVSGQEVPHVHFHIIPRKTGDGLGYRWNPTKYPQGRAEELQKQLLSALA